MKLTKYLAGYAAFAFAVSANASETVFVTGATAFRAATINAIVNQYQLGNGGVVSYKVGHDQATNAKLTSAGRLVFIGNFPGVAGTTTIKCCFTGSVEGIRALVLNPTTTTPVPAGYDPSPPTYFDEGLVIASSGDGTSTDNMTPNITSLGSQLTTTSDIAFSDVGQSSTPFTKKNQTLQPGDAEARAGVIVFTMVTNNSSVANVTSKQFRALLAGPQPLGLITGAEADVTAGTNSIAYVVGRNDYSGTRTTVLAETGFGITNKVQQYVVNSGSTSTGLTKIQLVPASGISTLTGGLDKASSSKNASNVWSSTKSDGNGGYDSGSGLTPVIGLSGSSGCRVYDASGLEINAADVAKVTLLAWISLSDAVTSRTDSNASFCKFNGVGLDGVAAGSSTLTTADKAKITNGAYTGWGYERMFYNNAITGGDKLTVYNAIFGELPKTIQTAGVNLNEMVASREVDGGVVSQ